MTEVKANANASAMELGLWRHRRKLDWVYVGFMVVHLLASVLIDSASSCGLECDGRTFH